MRDIDNPCLVHRLCDSAMTIGLVYIDNEVVILIP